MINNDGVKEFVDVSPSGECARHAEGMKPIVSHPGKFSDMKIDREIIFDSIAERVSDGFYDGIEDLYFNDISRFGYPEMRGILTDEQKRYLAEKFSEMLDRILER